MKNRAAPTRRTSGLAVPGLVWTQRSQSVLPAREVTVPLTAPGVLFGETLFETLRARRGTLFRLADHLARLRNGIEALAWGTPPSDEEIKAGLRAVLDSDELAGAHDVRLRITALRLDDSGVLESFIHGQPYEPPAVERYAGGVDAVVTSQRLDADAPWANFKTGQRLPHRLAGAEARQAGAWEGILLNTDGMLVDGTISNVHLVVDGGIITPSRRCGALPGITRQVVRELADHDQIPWEAGAYPPTVFHQATEAFVTNALIGLMPLVRIDGQPIGDGRPGPILKALSAAYLRLVDRQSKRPL